VSESDGRAAIDGRRLGRVWKSSSLGEGKNEKGVLSCVSSKVYGSGSGEI